MKKITNLTINNELENPVAFFELNGVEMALELHGKQRIMDGDMLGEIEELQRQIQVVNEIGDNLFIFDDFTIVYTGSEIWANT